MGEDMGEHISDEGPQTADGAGPGDGAGSGDGAGPGDNTGSAVTQAGLEYEARVLFVDSLVTTVRGLEFVESQMHALRLKAVAALHAEMRRVAVGPEEASEASSITAAEVAAALNVSQRTGRALVEEALALTDPGLAPVLEAMEEGRLDRRRARAVMEHACVLQSGKDAEFCAAAVELACPEGSDGAPTLGAFSRRLRRLAEKYHDEPLAARKEQATSFRKVEVEPAKDGMCWITAHLPVEVGAAIDTRLEALARSLQGNEESRGISQLRADVFRDLLLEGTPSSAGPDVAGGVRMEVLVTVPATTLSGQTETPGELLGYGAVDAPAARLLAAEAATWMSMYVDPESGAPLALGRRRYAPSLAIRRFLGARDRTCRFPGCDRPASATEADHTEEWQNGGSTDVANLALLCREHHRLKSLGVWKLRQVEQVKPERRLGAEGGVGPDDNRAAFPEVPAQVARDARAPSSGTLEWTSPTGRRYVTYPESDAPPPF